MKMFVRIQESVWSVWSVSFTHTPRTVTDSF